MKNLRKPLLVALCAAALTAAALPVTSQAAVDVFFNVAPPPPRVEIVPAPRAGWVWVPGYWAPRAHRHVWIAGHWERVRRGYAYVPPRWVERDHRWFYEQPRWHRGDRDGDGVPNYRDRAPNDPYRR